MRPTEQSTERASDFASVVLPTPGTSSSSRCPSASSTATVRRTSSLRPEITVSIEAHTAAAVSARSSSSAGVGSAWTMSTPLSSGGTDTNGAHPALGRAPGLVPNTEGAVSYTHLRAHETRHDLVCRLLLETKKQKNK